MNPSPCRVTESLPSVKIFSLKVFRKKEKLRVIAKKMKDKFEKDLLERKKRKAKK